MSKSEANRQLKEERRKLDDLAEKQKKQGVKHETSEYRRQNQRVADAEKKASWWRR